MKKCALCKEEKKSLKTNTHYLTDGIIRSAVNIDGTSSNKDRDKGFYFEVFSNKPSIEFNFQQNTPQLKLEEALNRPPNDDEIERAKQNHYSVDDTFCTDCEDKFTIIENEFIHKILPKFRSSDLSQQDDITLGENDLIRLFFYVQIWRTAICREGFELTSDIAETLRVSILNNKIGETGYFPLSVTYLETIDTEKCHNAVGILANKKNPNFIFMNEFVIQFYDSENNIDYFDFNGINSKENYKDYINVGKSDFIFKIVHDNNRIQFLKNASSQAIKHFVPMLREKFIVEWKYVHGKDPEESLIQEFFSEIAKEGQVPGVHQHSKKRILTLMHKFITERYPSK